MSNIDLAIPSPQQVAWQNLELGLFVHFGLNTFLNQEWGDGTDSPKVFNPTSLQALQWVKVAKDMGFKYFMLTAKHHDGFCLWPTETTSYSVKSSPWQNGAGDVVRECADACQQIGMPFGLYLSPWDRHEPCYKDQEAYDTFYCKQLTELLTSYGPIVEIWFDGAGSEGREYNWSRIIETVKRYQPDAMIFNMGQPTIRWAGNEDGIAPDPCWNSRQTSKVSLFSKEESTWLPGTPEWLPAECDVPIRGDHWFWHEHDEERLRSVDNLLEIYEKSVGRGANLLLNVAPDHSGLIPTVDIDRLSEWRSRINEAYTRPVASCFGNGHELTMELDGVRKIDVVMLKEEIRKGERIRSYKIEAQLHDKWQMVSEGTAVGHKRIHSFQAIKTNKLRLTINQAVGNPEIVEFSAFISKKI
ncbi:alpha-L-fucosidase [Alkalihalobacillus sp. NPDC078783]